MSRKKGIVKLGRKSDITGLASYRYMVLVIGEYYYSFVRMRTRKEAEEYNEKEWNGKGEVMTVKQALNTDFFTQKQ